ncbi:SCO family protein [candidate division GN15 bacterium]|uniref:SCO family protein n=1 Tax=candidate division GN15 bacterium TaxID=2072418 RepID=A0A855X7F2_9BACT|nr:MAG: SCO family protein [candidate division GN15 bacterium]
MKGVGITEHLGSRIPTDLKFTDDHGRNVTLGEYFGDGKPVVLDLVYYDCPMLCTYVLNGVTTAAKQLPWTPGKEYRLVTISINPREHADLAAAKKAIYLHELGKPGAESGWSFLVGDSTQSRALADALGWQYYYDAKIKEYVHTAATFVLTPNGTISRYLYGIEYKPQDLKLALLEASEGKIGNTIDKLVLYCFHYDPNAKGYVLFAQNVMKIGGAVAVVVLGLFLLLLWRRERKSHSGAFPALKPR